MGVRRPTAVSEAVGVVGFIWRHPANRGRRARQLGRAVSFQVRARLFGHRVLAPVGRSGQIWVDLHRRAATKALYANPPDWPEMAVWQERLSPGDLFLDVGANVGTYTVFAASLGATVVAFEPAHDTVELLRENVALNGYDDVEVVEAAAGAAASTVQFTSGLDSVNRVDDHGGASVTMVTLDSIIGDRTVAGMKVDVEGFEIDVLRGASRALADHRIELMQLEWNDASVEAVGSDRAPVAELLASHGYALYRPDADGRLVATRDAAGIADVFAAPVR